jgi:hypothetical protein
VGVRNPYAARFEIIKRRDELIKIANEKDPVLVGLGGGAKDIDARVVQTIAGPMVNSPPIRRREGRDGRKRREHDGRGSRSTPSLNHWREV